MKKTKVFIIGSSGYAKVIIDIIEKMGQFEIIGLTDESRAVGEMTLGYTILGNENKLPQLFNEYPEASVVMAIGDNWTRFQAVQRIFNINPNVSFPSIIHPSAQIAKEVILGKGVVIMAGAIINSSSSIGDFTIINTKASLDHDNILEKFASLAPNATTGGNVQIGAFSAIGISATIKHGTTVGEQCVIGASSFLYHNCEANSVMYGVPAKKIRTRKQGEKYL
jgi:sugar O-acyltransferase (sialic acid O-acetyltransferase NeuD family)